jgi:hypothetical protein
VVAVGFLDEDRVMVGSHSGIGVFDVGTGQRVERTFGENYSWYQSEPPFIKYPSADGVRLILAAGLWGGDLDQSTIDGWSCHRVDGGAALRAPGPPDVKIEDSDEYRARLLTRRRHLRVCDIADRLARDPASIGLRTAGGMSELIACPGHIRASGNSGRFMWGAVIAVVDSLAVTRRCFRCRPHSVCPGRGSAIYQNAFWRQRAMRLKWRAGGGLAV